MGHISQFCLPQQLFANKEFRMDKEIVQYLQNSKCYKKAILESPYKVPQISQKATIVEGLNFQRLKDAIFKDCSILVYFQRLNCHNFYPILNKVAKLHFF